MSSNNLERARHLDLPSREAMLHRTPEVYQFWDTHQDLLKAAWQEWETNDAKELIKPNTSLLDPALRQAVEEAWQDPSKEDAVKALWEEVSPGVFQTQFFDLERIKELRAYLNATADAEIPLRPPYGIALNRHGAMLDPRSEGFLAAPGFQDFYRDIMNAYMRPIARLLFPEIVGYDAQTFGFSIRYQPGVETSLRLHTDASAATLNVNLNLPGESFTGSEVDFFDPLTGDRRRLSFEPGVAMLHRGDIPHAAQPIQTGERTNLVFWLYGNRGQIPRYGNEALQVDPRTRWSIPTEARDSFAPF